MLQRRNGALCRCHRHRAGIAPERRGQKVAVPEHRLALREVRDRPACGVARGITRMGEEVGRRAVTLRLPGVRVDGIGREPEGRRLALPGLTERDLVHVALGRPGHQRGAGGEVSVPGRRAETTLGHCGLDLRAARRERLDHLAGDARDLEAAVFVRLLDPVPEFAEALGQFRPVDRPDRHVLAVEAVVHHRPPLAVPALDHVGDHAVRVELGIEVARGVVAEGRGHHLLAAHADHRARRLVLHPGPDGVLLDPREGPAHRLVVRLGDALVAAHHRHEGDRLRGREGHVAPGTVLDPAVLAAPAELRPVRNLALEDLAEGVRVDRAREPEGLGALARPATGLAVRRVILGVVAVALVIARALGRGGDDAERGYHRAVPAPAH